MILNQLKLMLTVRQQSLIVLKRSVSEDEVFSPQTGSHARLHGWLQDSLQVWLHDCKEMCDNVCEHSANTQTLHFDGCHARAESIGTSIVELLLPSWLAVSEAGGFPFHLATSFIIWRASLCLLLYMHHVTLSGRSLAERIAEKDNIF